MMERVARTLVATCALAASACSSMTPWSGGSSIEFLSNTQNTGVKPDMTVRVYASTDPNTADIYLTDLPELADSSVPTDSLTAATGHIVHIHMFIAPEAGKTPIAFTAANCTFTHIILADGAMGVYQGGGFLLPDSKLGGSSFGGRTAQATLRPTAATTGFVDLLGWNEAQGHIRVTLDVETAHALDARIATLMRRPDLVVID
jgi:hypothetical protein